MNSLNSLKMLHGYVNIVIYGKVISFYTLLCMEISHGYLTMYGDFSWLPYYE